MIILSIQQFEIEVNGIIGTITNYTKNPYIVGYTNCLRKYVNENEKDMVLLIIKKLIVWYTINIDSILSNEYIANKSEHISTKELLELTFKELSN